MFVWGKPLIFNNFAFITCRSGQGLLRKWQLIFYGTDENPVRVPRNINADFRTGKALFNGANVNNGSSRNSGRFSSSSSSTSSSSSSPAAFSFPAPTFTFPNFFNTFKRFKRSSPEEEGGNKAEDDDMDLDYQVFDTYF